MEHTKGKLEVQEYGGLFAIGTHDDAICKLWELEEETHNKLEFENAEANAKRLVKCWNEREDLVKACEKALNLLRIAGKGELVKTPTGEMLIKVLAEAKKE